MFWKLAPDIIRVINLSVLLSFFSKCSVTYSVKSGSKISSTGMSDMLEVNPMLEGFLSSWTCYKFMVLTFCERCRTSVLLLMWLLPFRDTQKNTPKNKTKPAPKQNTPPPTSLDHPLYSSVESGIVSARIFPGAVSRSVLNALSGDVFTASRGQSSLRLIDQSNSA